MKLIKHSAIALLIVGFASCKKEELNVVEQSSTATPLIELFPTEEAEQTYAIQVVNARTGEPIGITDNTTIDVLFKGADVSSITEVGGSTVSQVTTERGMALVSSARVGTRDNPFEVNAVVAADGYLATSKRIESIDSGHQVITIEMVKIDETPTGVTAELNDKVTTTNDTTSASVSIIADKSTVTIPAGVKMEDASGNAITGAVKSTMVYFNSEDDEAIAALPDGVDGAFPIGTVSLEMADANGNKVKTFKNKSVSIAIEIPATTNNQETGSPIKAGDTLAVYSYDTETAAWKYENTTTVTGPLTNGNFQAVIKATHLSYWNVSSFSRNYSSCKGYYNDIAIKIDGKDASYSNSLNLSLYNKKTGKLVGKFQNRGRRIVFRKSSTEEHILKLTAPKGCNSRYIGELSWIPCPSSSSLALEGTLNLTTNPDYVPTVTITADLSGVCKNDPTINIKPTATAYFYKTSGGSNCTPKFGSTSMKKGKATVENIQVGATYLAYMYYNKQWLIKSFTVKAGETHYNITGTFNSPVCD